MATDYDRMKAMLTDQAARAATGRNVPATNNQQRILAATPARQITQSMGITQPTLANINAANRGYAPSRTAAAIRNPVRPPATRPPANTGGSGRSGGGGGGGGGGGAAVPQFTQEQLAQMAELLRQGGPQRGQALDLPDYQAYAPKAFDDSMYRAMQGQLDQAQQTDLGTAQKGTQDYLNFLTSNYQNAFTNPNNTYAQAGQAPGMDIMSMQRMLQAQGVDPSVMAGVTASRMGADQAMGNLWRSSAANEDVMQRNRIGAGQLSGQDAANRINALAMGGRAGINQQQGAAKSAYDQRVEEWAREDAAQQQAIAQQEAMQNWTQGNEYQTQQQAYRNATLQALLGLMPELQGTGLQLPNAQSLGWA